MDTVHGANGAAEPRQQASNRYAEIPDEDAQCAIPVAPRLMDDVEAILEQWRGRFHDQLSLAALEARLAGENLVVILAYGTVVGVLLGGASLAATGALVLWLVRLGVPASLAMLLGALLMTLCAGLFARAIRRRSRSLQFPATIRSLKPEQKLAASTASAEEQLG